MRIVIVGNGKMGQAVAASAQTRGHVIHTVISGAENAGGQAITPERTWRSSLAGRMRWSRTWSG